MDFRLIGGSFAECTASKESAERVEEIRVHPRIEDGVEPWVCCSESFPSTAATVQARHADRVVATVPII